MVRYASKECRICSAVYPANTMVRVSDSVKSGHSSASFLVLLEKNGLRRYINSYRNYYNNASFFLCPPCHADWKRSRTIKHLFYLALLGGMGFVVYFLISRPISKDASALSSPPAVNKTGSAFLDSYGQNVDEAASDQSNAEPPDGAVESPQPETDQPSVVTEEPTPDKQPAPEATYVSEAQPSYPTPNTSPALAEAISNAATKGKTVRWSDQGFEGYVVPSEVQSGGSCRSVYYTNDEDGWKSDVLLICP